MDICFCNKNTLSLKILKNIPITDLANSYKYKIINNFFTYMLSINRSCTNSIRKKFFTNFFRSLFKISSSGEIVQLLDNI